MTPPAERPTTLRVQLGERSYPVVATNGDGPARARALVAGRTSFDSPPWRTPIALVTDATVDGLHAQSLSEALTFDGRAPARIVVPPGEGSKSVATLERVWHGLQDAGLDRRGLVVALGGGVVGDLAGFAAATWLRGVDVLHLPTTLLAMVDSAVGGKTAIDLRGKNQVGALHQPIGVVADVAWLSTLPPREVRAGLAEAWKTALLTNEVAVGALERDAARVVARDPDALLGLVSRCAAHKAAVVAKDEREQGQRAWLNLGHTLGHALEAQDPSVLHGEAIAVGVAFALHLAHRTGRLDVKTRARALALGRALGLRLSPRGRIDLDALAPLIAKDKKVAAGEARWVLPRGFGPCDLTTVTRADLDAALAELVLNPE